MRPMRSALTRTWPKPIDLHEALGDLAWHFGLLCRAQRGQSNLANSSSNFSIRDRVAGKWFASTFWTVPQPAMACG